MLRTTWTVKNSGYFFKKSIEIKLLQYFQYDECTAWQEQKETASWPAELTAPIRNFLIVLTDDYKDMRTWENNSIYPWPVQLLLLRNFIVVKSDPCLFLEEMMWDLDKLRQSRLLSCHCLVSVRPLAARWRDLQQTEVCRPAHTPKNNSNKELSGVQLLLTWYQNQPMQHWSYWTTNRASRITGTRKWTRPTA